MSIEQQNKANPSIDKIGQDEIEGRTAKSGTDSAVNGGNEQPAGPHAKPELTNPDATPGSGSLPEPEQTRDVDPGVG